VGGTLHTSTDFSPASTTRSLENSLRTLGVERLDILLLHEVQPHDLESGSLLEWLQRQKERGVAQSVGLATTAVAASTILRANPGVFDVVQVPSHVLAPASDLIGDTPGPLRITHSVLAAPLAMIHDRMQRDPRWVRELVERCGVDVTAPGMLARLLLALGLGENRDGIVLLGTSNAEHLRSAPAALDETETPRLGLVAQFLRQSFCQ
jgi:aryl-alcohol dehydrogenase-like predicted oxidoreductase